VGCKNVILPQLFNAKIKQNYLKRTREVKAALIKAMHILKYFGFKSSQGII
jgi:hypothetical protein